MTAVATDVVLRGPDPDQFRTSHYGARWYIDPLPADPTWPATKDKWPSVTTIKKAWSKPFRKRLPTGERVPLDAYWAAEFTVANLAAINALAHDPAAVMALISGAGGRTLNRAADRGSGVHTVLETLGAGQPVDELLLDPAVLPFVPACRAFIADWQPRWVATEVICFNRTLGFAGTADAIITIDRPGIGPWTCLVDWKSRGGQHGAYEDEIAQLGGYSLAEYLVVVAPDGRPMRIPPVDVDGVLVVSLNADGYEATPADLGDARAAFEGMLASWRGQREGQKAARAARGHPLPAGNGAPAGDPSTPGESGVEGTGQADATVTPPPTVASADRVTWLLDRIRHVVEAGHEAALAGLWNLELVPAPLTADTPLTDQQVDHVVEWCAAIEARLGFPFPATDPLFAALAAADQPPTPPAPAPTAEPVDVARDEIARHWADRGRELLATLDADDIAAAVLTAAGIDGTETMTADLYTRLEALVTELGSVDPPGAVHILYGPEADDIAVVPAPEAEARMIAAAGTKGEARDRAARLAKRMGRIAPRSLVKAAENPLLAALVAAGHGANTNTDTQESENQ